MNLKLIENAEAKTIQGYVGWTDGNGVDLGIKDSGAYVRSLVTDQHPRVGLLPPAVRWISGDKRILVFERPPGFQTISYLMLARDHIATLSSEVLEQHIQSYTLPMPWLVYVIGFGVGSRPVTLRVYSRPKALECLDSPVYLFPMLNFYANSKLCLPIFEKFESHEPTLAAGIQAAYNTVWNSGFNYDLSDAAKTGASYSFPVAGNKKPGLTDWQGAYFARWSALSIDQVLSSKFINPAEGDNHNVSPMGASLTLKDAIRLVNKELMTSHMGSESLAKNFITTLVNNFNLC